MSYVEPTIGESWMKLRDGVYEATSKDGSKSAAIWRNVASDASSSEEWGWVSGSFACTAGARQEFAAKADSWKSTAVEAAAEAEKYLGI